MFFLLYPFSYLYLFSYSACFLFTYFLSVSFFIHPDYRELMTTALVVEDSLTDRALLTDYLRRTGMTVTSANSSEEALTMLKAAHPDLLLLDVVLPGQSGFELCHDLKTNESTRNIPIIICSTKDTDADKLWSSMLGADAYLTKPVTQQQLSDLVKKLMP